MSVTEDGATSGNEAQVLKQLINQRKGHRSYVTKILKKADDLLAEYEEGLHRITLNSYKAQIADKLDVLKGFDDKVTGLLVEESQLEEEIERASDIRGGMQEQILRIDMMLAKNEKKSDGGSRDKSAKLPKLTLKPFSGNPLEYQSFWDSFNAAVHQNGSLEDVTKFNYLRSFLQGPALSAINGLALTKKNYVEALAILEEQFGNIQLLISSNMGKLLNIPSVNSVDEIEKIRDVYNRIETCVRNLKSLSVDRHQYGSVLVSVVMAKLPEEIRLVISRTMPSKQEWNIDEFLETLRREVESREICGHMKGKRKGQQKVPPPPEFEERSRDADYTGSTLFTSSDDQNSERKVNCTYCRRNHISSRCDVITNAQARKAHLKRKGKCFVCLRASHIARQCTSQMKCFKCSQRHHVSICDKNLRDRVPPPAEGNVNRVQDNAQSHNMITTTKKNTLLQTAKAKILTEGGREGRVRILFDSCSQRSFINENISKKLQLPVMRTERMIVQGFESKRVDPRKIDVVRAKIQGINRSLSVDTELCVVPKICSPISCQNIELAQVTYDQIIGLDLADSTDGSSNLEVDVLIGGDCYWRFMTGKFIRGKDGPVALHTILGWVLSGPIEGANSSITTNLVTNHVLMIESNTADEEVAPRDKRVIAEVSKFWNIEDVASDENSNDLVQEFNSIERIDRRYFVDPTSLWKSHADLLPDNYSLALSRLTSLYNRLKRDPEKMNQYDDIIRTQIKEGIVETCDPNDTPEIGQVHYIPHREIIKEDRETTKMRIVYDCSAKRKGKLSLNDCLQSGPSMLPKIFDILVRFRAYKYALVSDVKSAFLNIRFTENFRNFVRFLWFESMSETEPLVSKMRFTSVLFGLTCSPFLLCRTVDKHMKQYIDIDREFVDKFLRDLYMDDNASGTQDLERAFDYYLFTKTLMLEGSFDLRKWHTNSEMLSNWIQEYEKKFFGNDMTESQQTTKILGIQWNKIVDVFAFNLKPVIMDALKSDTVTKRRVLSIVSSIYDPLGFLSCYTINLKLLFQEVCSFKCDWDAQLTTEFITKWEKCLNTLMSVEEVNEPRHYLNAFSLKEVESIQLHGFADASEKAYAAVVYLKFILCDKQTHISFVTSKTKVVPLVNKGRKITIPRLELMSALILSKLLKAVMNSLSGVYDISRVVCWTDNMDTYFWIVNRDKVWKKFMQTRAEKIRNNLPTAEWRHVPGEDNPADLPTRGLALNTEERKKKWFHGPEFLSKGEDAWPTIPCVNEKTGEYSHEQSTVNATIVASTNEINLNEIFDLNRYSSLIKLLYVTSYVIRFINKLKKRVQKLNVSIPAELTTDEIETAKDLWITNEQKQIISDKKRFKELQYSLGIYKDEKGILRVKGRLENSDVETRFPIFLDRKSYLTELIIYACHEKVKHYKLKDTLLELRSVYHVSQGRRTVDRVLRKCTVCTKTESKRFRELPVAPLPVFRVTAQIAFSSTGVDYLGPLMVKNIFTRDPMLYKVHIVLYTCAASRAVHLDIVPDTTCLAFVRSLKRFISRHGISRLFISDNATNFTGPELTSFMHQTNIEWKYILSASPWWGGFWERLVQTTKRCLRKMLGKEKLNYEELLTIVMEIEGVMNSRPLCYIYDNDPMDDVITPSHMVMGRRLLSVFRDDIEPENVDFSTESITKRCKYMNTLLKNFWGRWKREYLTELREFHNCKNRLPTRQVSVGDVVLIGDDDLPRNRWRMGIVHELIYGKDKLVRGCNIRTLTPKHKRVSYLSRPITKLYPLEIKSSIYDQPEKNPDATETRNLETASSEPTTENNLRHTTDNVKRVTENSRDDISVHSANYSTSTRPRRTAAEKGVQKRIREKQK